ncbi:hypothetical protein, partial [Rhizobium sp.]|uniref:hypothetical protein n=1 Tax=Rhizobium sp. TaxID=391 RepID=UPI0028B0A5E8
IKDVRSTLRCDQRKYCFPRCFQQLSLAKQSTTMNTLGQKGRQRGVSDTEPGRNGLAPEFGKNYLVS